MPTPFFSIPLPCAAGGRRRPFTVLACACITSLLAACAASPYGDDGQKSFGQATRSALQSQALTVISPQAPAGVTHGEVEPALARWRAAPTGSGPAMGGNAGAPRPLLP